MKQYSHILFSLYMDGLFEQLEKSGDHYTGCIGYADDLTLLTPTRSGFNRYMRKICPRILCKF